MKHAILCIIVIFAGYFLVSKAKDGRLSNHSAGLTTPKLISSDSERPLDVVYFQDVSKSIQRTGVEIISSGVFVPFYNDLHRAIMLNIGVISEHTARTLISVWLPPAMFRMPSPVDVSGVLITDRKTVSNEYKSRVQKYVADSIVFFEDRRRRISEFRHGVDSMLDPYRQRKSPGTDLIPAIAIAEKAFNFSGMDRAMNVLILNTDGLDSRHRKAKPMRNAATIIMVNANGIIHTDLDAIVNISLQSTEQAIRFTLSQTKN